MKTPVPASLQKKKLWHRYFPVYFAKFLGTPFLTEHFWATASDFIFSKKGIIISFLCQSLKC